MKKYKFIFTYLTTNLINGKKYFGVHGADNLDTDDYIGSGIILKRAINKYGRENFHREIDQFHESYEDAFIHEEKIVNEAWIKDKNTYNVRKGGLGGMAEETIKRIKLTITGRNHTESLSPAAIQRYYENTRTGKDAYWYNKTHTDEAKQKIGKASKERGFSKKFEENRLKSLVSLYKVTTPSGEIFENTPGEKWETFSNRCLNGLKMSRPIKRYINKGKVPDLQPEERKNKSRMAIIGWTFEKYKYTHVKTDIRNKRKLWLEANT